MNCDTFLPPTMTFSHKMHLFPRSFYHSLITIDFKFYLLFYYIFIGMLVALAFCHLSLIKIIIIINSQNVKLLADRTVAQFYRLLALSCCLSVRPSVSLYMVALMVGVGVD